MKKIILLILLSLFSFVGYSQAFVEDFEGAPNTPDATTGVWALPTSASFGNWLVRDNRTNTGVSWRVGIANINPPHTGTNCAFVNVENVGQGVTSEEWLITPQLDIQASRQLRFFTRQGFSGDLGTKYQVRVSSSANQSDLASYTVLVEYTEQDLSTITPDQQDYEEKLINLGFTGLRYLAFVKVFTQPQPSTTADKWLIDDVRIIERCIDPITPLGAPTTGATSATVSWTMPAGSTQTNFDIEYGISGFTQGSPQGTIVNVTTAATGLRTAPISGLQPGLAYQFYVRSHCSDDNTSIWVGPFNFSTTPLGSVCADPIVVPSALPYCNASNTGIYGNNITAGTPGGGCGGGNGFLGGNDVVYSYTVPATTTGVISIQMDPQGVANTGVFVYDSCAAIGTACIAGVGNNNGSVRNIPVLNVVAGQVIYVVISSTAAVGTFAYNLCIQDVNCAPPTGLSAAGINPTSASLSWQNPSSANNWQYVVQTAGSPIPTGAGEPTTNNTNVIVSALTGSGTPLAFGTSYQYWVRADCGDGTWSQWSGPYVFTTTNCTNGGCNYSFVMTDSFGDGWNGAVMNIVQNAVTVASIGSTFTTGNGPITVNVALCNGPFSLVWTTAGTFPGEVGISVVNSFGQTLFTKPSGTGAAGPTPIYTGEVNCSTPACLAPTELVTSNITPHGVKLQWTANGPDPAGGWDIYVVTTGSPAPTNLSTPDFTGVTNPFTIDEALNFLDPDTAYTFYVRAVCGVGSTSPWSAASASFTTLPTCPKPTALTLADFDLNSMTLSWTPGFNETQWQYYVTLAGDPAPTPDAPEWSTPVNTPSVPLIFLPQSTCFDVYVRGICSPTDISTISGPVTGCTTNCPATDQCLHTFTLTDSFGDGWNGARMEVRQSGIVLATLGANFTGGAGPIVVTVPLCNGIPFELFWTTAGTFPGEVRIAVTNSFDQTVYAITTASAALAGTLLYTGDVDCANPLCLPPGTLTASDPTPHGATLTWVQNGTIAPDSWSIYAVPAGSPAPVVGTDIPVAVVTDTAAIPPYVLDDPSILADTDYVFYVVSNCAGANPTSQLSTVSTIFHTLPTCPKPTALNTLNPDMNSIDFNWTPGGTETAWEYFYQAAGLPAPTASTPGWIPTTTTTVNIAPLDTATAYDFYVRGICTADTDISTVSGPATGNTTICPAAEQCNYTFTLTDSFGDGWNGARMQVRQNGIVVATLGANFTGGAGPIVVTVPICPGVPMDLFWITGGTFPGEVRISVSNSFQQTLFSITTASAALAGTVLYSNATPSCTVPECQTPLALGATPFTYNAALTWNFIPGVTYEVLVVPQGSPVPTAATPATYTPVTTNPFFTDPQGGPNALSPLTNYTFYVRMVCTSSTTPWSSGFNFTTLPTCPRPQNITIVATTTTDATISFTEMGTATTWEVWVLPQGSPVPTPGDANGHIISPTAVGGVVTINTLTDLGMAGMFPGSYDFYVHAICSPTDSSVLTDVVDFYILNVDPICASVTPQNPEIDANGVINLCPGETCVDLTATYTDNKQTTSYVVESIPFAPPFPFDGGIELTIDQDDIWGEVFTLPFPFCFFGTEYPNVQVGSNGVLSFGSNFPANVGGGCPWNTDPAVTVPSATFPIRNAIYGVYQDIDPTEPTTLARSINYQVLGTAPCRTFVLNFVNIGQFQCGEDVGLQTSQIVLYETSNNIEVYVKDRTSCTTWNDGLGVIGIQNAAGTVGYVPPGRNLGTWETQNEAWQFKPDGASNVVFSWLKDGAFYSNEPTINVCVSETTNMTAQAVYNGCGGVVTTKASDVLLKVNDVDVLPMEDVTVCDCYTLPVLANGSYFTGPDGTGDQLAFGSTVCSNQTVYIYDAVITSTQTCSDQESFTVTIAPVTAPTLPDASACDAYILPDLATPGFDYYDGPGGTGTMYAGTGGGSIATSGTIYIYGMVGTCSAESQFEVTIGTVQAPIQGNLSSCTPPVTLPALGANLSYYTATGGPNGSGTLITDLNITTSQTIYIFAQSGTCQDESSFTVTIQDSFTPQFAPVANPCIGDVPPVLPLVSNEGVIGTWSPLVVATDTAGTTVYTFTPSIAFPCAVPTTLSVTVNAPVTPTFNLVPDVCVGGISPVLPTTSLEGITGTWLPAVVDTSVAGTTCYTFTPDASQTCTLPTTLCVTVTGSILPTFDPIANICQNTTAPALPLTSLNGIVGSWTPAAIDVTIVGPSTYTFNPDTTLSACAISTTLVVTIDPSVLPTFAPIADICQNSTAPTLPTTSINGVTGTWSPAIDTTITGSQTLNFTPDAGQLCALPTTMTINVIAPLVPDFVDITLCHSTPAPVLSGTSPNGITGSWSPAVIDNTLSGSYTFTPNIFCALPQTINVTVTPQVTPNFAPIANFCSGATAPILATTAPNGITGTWSPATVSNTQSGCYVFTPTAGQCAQPQTVCVTVDPTLSPNFAEIGSICSGSVAPILATTSNGVTGTWSPATVSTTESGNYVFTPDAGQCAVGQTLAVNIITLPEIEFNVGCVGGSYMLSVKDPIEGASYSWSHNNVAIDNPAANGPGINLTQLGTGTGQYAVTATVGDCDTEQGIAIMSVSCDIQKGISPRGTGAGDNKNDFFDLAGQNVKKLEIFNRYGTKVYSKGNYINEWYGQSDNGNELPDGTYYYVIEYNTGGKSKTGWIYINREQ